MDIHVSSHWPSHAYDQLTLPYFYFSYLILSMHNSPRTCYIRPLEQVKKYKKFLLNDGDFMNEFKLQWTVNNFLIYYNPKQI